MKSSSFMPMKAVLCCRVKQTLLKGIDPDLQQWPLAFDDPLIKELTTTLRQSAQYRDRFAACTTKTAAAAIAEKMVAEIAATYQALQIRKQDDQVQQLNHLLE